MLFADDNNPQGSFTSNSVFLQLFKISPFDMFVKYPEVSSSTKEKF